MRVRLALFTVVWHKAEYRAFFLIMVLLSLAVSSTLPLVTLYLVDHQHVALSQVGLFFACQSVVGLILGLLVGRWSDRWISRLPAMRLASIWVAVGWLIFALAPHLWLIVVAGVVFLSAGSITMGQTFAALHDVMVRDGETQTGLVNTTVRTAFSLGFVVGPLLGSALAVLISFRPAFLLAGFLNLLCLIPLYGLDVRVSSAGAREPKETGPTQSNVRLYIFVGLCTLLLIGTALRLTYLPIDVTRHLGAGVGLYGSVMAVSPLGELITMPAAALLAIRFGIGRLFRLGLVVATIEYLILCFNTALWQVYLAQVMDALVVAVVFGLGLTYAQQLSPNRAGLASSAFGSAFGIAILVGNLIGSVSVSFLGVPHIFFIPFVTSGMALATFIGLERTATRHGELVGGIVST